MKKITFSIIIALAFFTITLNGQDSNILSKAFDSSYIYENKGSYEKAARFLEQQYNADSYEMNLRLGWLTYLAGNQTQSMDYYDKAILLAPYAIEPRLGYVLPLTALGNWNEVLVQYNKILEVDPMNTYVNYKVGMIYYYREQYDVALSYFEKVANLYPFDYDSNIMYAWTSYRLGMLREAKVLFQKVLLMKPNDDSALQGLGMIK
jgi:tetratricopeptide (TPR) repeat protein